ncbi:hypothetical protein CYMTET_9415 [Cymbomonas tetramitiformis]|uniref:Uncharacterized protein n=1 Tax=Cymbomonas tetramitiformis TaxID=36881 RepID=A0AAE0GRJ1_9CHLO|nr:hypothetical protein CYMTET_9415 [Cymbomonas tetramitiformis]
MHASRSWRDRCVHAQWLDAQYAIAEARTYEMPWDDQAGLYRADARPARRRPARSTRPTCYRCYGLSTSTSFFGIDPDTYFDVVPACYEMAVEIDEFTAAMADMLNVIVSTAQPRRSLHGIYDVMY